MYRLKSILCLVFVFLFVFCISYFFLSTLADEVWNYGFAYNISRGLVPYRDFNMVVTPLYSFILSIFLMLFGHHFIIMSFFNCLIITLMIYFMYKKIKIDVFFIFPIILYCYINGYNLLSVFFVLLLLVLFNENFKHKDFVFGLVVGLLILTKQTVGVCVLIPLFMLNNNKFKFLLGLIIPLSIFIIYLVYNNALYNFVDYCFLGMFDFAGDNKYYMFLPLECLIILLLIYFLKTKQVDKSGWIVLMFQVIVFPIFDINHFLLGISIFLFYLLYNFKVNKFLKILFLFIGIIIIVRMIEFPSIVKDKESFLFGKNFNHFEVLNFINKHYYNKRLEFDNLYFFSDLTYIVKLTNNDTLNKFDLINNGNMGYNGEKKYIKEINNKCSKESCYFILDKHYVDMANGKIKRPSTNQTNLNIIRFVEKKYLLVDSKNGFNFYSNYN